MKLRRKIVPLCLKTGPDMYTGDSWLGLIIAPLLYYALDVSDEGKFLRVLEELVAKELGVSKAKAPSTSLVASASVSTSTSKLLQSAPSTTVLGSGGQGGQSRGSVEEAHEMFREALRSFFGGGGNKGGPSKTGNNSTSNEFRELVREEVRKLVRLEFGVDAGVGVDGRGNWWTGLSASQVHDGLLQRGLSPSTAQRLQEEGVDGEALGGLMANGFDGVLAASLFGLKAREVLQLRGALCGA